MSGSVGRSYLIQQWNDASSYSGEMIGQRLKESTDLYLANGKANIGLFEEKPKSPAKKKSAFDSIMLADRNYSRLSNLSQQLDEELDAGQIDLESWAAARKNIDVRLQKAWQRVCKERNWNNEGKEELEDYSNSLTFDCEDWYVDKQAQKQVDFNVIPKSSVFSELSDQNVFKVVYKNLLTAKRFMSSLWVTGKDIAEEGLI